MFRSPMSVVAVAACALFTASIAVAGCGATDAAAPPAAAGPPSGPAPAASTSSPAMGTASASTASTGTAPTGTVAASGDPVAAVPDDMGTGGWFGGCARYADPAQAALIAQQPVLEVIAGDAQLSWLHSALTGAVSPEVNYTDVLKGGVFTVFAPVDSAISAELENELREDPALLRFLLDFHVVPGRGLSPQELVETAGSSEFGTVTTLQGWGLPVFAPSDGSAPLALSEDAVVPLCGDITTADAALYLVPGLMHPAGDYTVPGSE